MNVEAISMDPRIARIHYADYRKKCREHRERRGEELKQQAAEAGKELGRIRIARTRMEKEDDELLRAYRALCRGQRILDINKTIVAGGWNEQRLPKLAVCRADAERCHFYSDNPRMGLSREEWWNWRRVPSDTFFFFGSGVPGEYTNDAWRRQNQFPVRATALVPSVPPHLRPANLSDYFILWEAEWEAKAPVDPMLLSRVNSTMFAIVAQWDLTPLEQRVLEGRL